VRGRPPPGRGTRSPSSTTRNCGLSPRCPAVITIDSGFYPCSAARWTLVDRPPRERPSPRSAGSARTPPGGPACRSPFPCPGRMLMRPHHGGIHTDIPADQPGGIRPHRQTGHDGHPGPTPLPAPEQPADRRPGPVNRRHIPPGRTGPHLPPDPVDELALRPLRRAACLRAGWQQRLQHRPLRIRQVRPPRHRYGSHSSTGDLTHPGQRHASTAPPTTQPAFKTRPSTPASFCDHVKAAACRRW